MHLSAVSTFAQLQRLWRLPAERVTPVVVVDEQLLKANLQKMSDRATQRGVRVRPHVKTHKSLQIARLQMQLGAVGITASKPQEALVFIRAGIPSVTVAYPVVSVATAAALLDAARAAHCDLRFVVDSYEGVKAVAQATPAQTSTPVFMEIDVGLERCGVLPCTAAMRLLAREIVAERRLVLKGLLSHAGHAYGAKSKSEIVAIARAEADYMRACVAQLREQGIDVEEISIGSTPTVLQAEDFGIATEIRPGNYVFLDATAVRLGIAAPADVALAVISTVVSVNDRYCIMDAGSKVLSSDSGPHGTGAATFGTCITLSTAPWAAPRDVVRLSEEHGFVEHAGDPVPIGTQLLVFPAHSCPVVNLADRLLLLSEDGSSTEWRVDA